MSTQVDVGVSERSLQLPPEFHASARVFLFDHKADLFAVLVFDADQRVITEGVAGDFVGGTADVESEDEAVAAHPCPGVDEPGFRPSRAQIVYTGVTVA